MIHQGLRYTLGLVHVEKGTPLKDVLQKLLQVVRDRKIAIKCVLLDKEFFTVQILTYLARARTGYVVPAVVRGRRPKNPRARLTGLRDLRRRKNGYYCHTLRSGKRQVQLKICVASKGMIHSKKKKRITKKLMYAIHRVRLTPLEIRELYRRRFGIETTYRQMQEARIKTCTRCPRIRLLLIGIALILRNVWVWLHFQWARNKYGAEPIVYLELLRFRQMLDWIRQVIDQVLGADGIKGLDLETFQRVRAQN